MTTSTNLQITYFETDAALQLSDYNDFMDWQPGSHVGSYTILRRIGAGGMGEVWEAEDTVLHRRVALKVLKSAVSIDEESRARLLREGRTAAQLNHPNIATIHTMEQRDDAVVIVMEFVEGEPLSSIIARGPMAEADVCAIGRGVCAALSAAHAKGIIHRDIKPDNIIITAEGVKVLDFGIAKQIGAARAAGSAPTFATEAGVILGTVFYMSPEQALGRELDARTDIFSLGAVLYEAVTGRLPFDGPTATEVILKIVQDEPPDARQARPQVSGDMQAILRCCLAKDRTQRFDSAAELSAALERVGNVAPAKGMTERIEISAAPTQRETKPARRSGTFVIVGLVFAVVLAAVLVVSNVRRAPEPVIEEMPTEASMATVAPPVVETTVTETTPSPDLSTSGATSATTIEVASAAVADEPVVAQVAEQQPAMPPAETLYRDGLRLVREGRGVEAAAEFRNVLRIDPQHAQARLKLGELLVAAGKLRVAREEFAAALANRERLDEREALLAEWAVAALDREPVRARLLGARFASTYPGDEEFEMLRRLLSAGQPRPLRKR
ncbi:MAG: serine/threonine-protein kinase [Thermoanaerobaculia bacterium]